MLRCPGGSMQSGRGQQKAVQQEQGLVQAVAGNQKARCASDNSPGARVHGVHERCDTCPRLPAPHLCAAEQNCLAAFGGYGEGGGKGGARRRSRLDVPVTLGKPPGRHERLEQRRNATTDSRSQRSADVAGLSAHSTAVVQDEAPVQVGPAGQGGLQLFCRLLLGQGAESLRVSRDGCAVRKRRGYDAPNSQHCYPWLKL